MSSAQNRRREVSYFICVDWKSSVKPQWTSEPFQSQFQFSCVCVCVCVEEDGTDTHTCTSFFNGWIAPIVLAAAVITPAAGILSFSFSGHNTAPHTIRWAQCVIQLWQEYSHLPEDQTITASRANLQAPNHEEENTVAHSTSHYYELPPSASVRKWKCQALLCDDEGCCDTQP